MPVLVNDIKKNDRVTYADGSTAIVKDNLRGLIRMVEKDLIGGEGIDIGSDYAFRWKTVQVDGEEIPVVMTPAQQKQAEDIKLFMGDD